jgi:general nucleoside transport system ATP-binding protein
VKLELRGIHKRYGATVASQGVDLVVESGEVVALLGENGAGKSTLMRILYGLVAPDAGQILIDDRAVELASPRRARALGIGMVFQQFSLIPALSVTENLALDAERVPFFGPLRARSLRVALGHLRELAPGLDPNRRVAELNVSEKQLVELAKALSRGQRLLILDEPTSVLARSEADALLGRVRSLARAGHAVILITHKLEDVAAAADRVVVLRRGRVVAETRAVRDRDSLVRAMLGEATPARAIRRSRATSEPRLELRGVYATSGARQLGELDFSVARGEVLGIAGVTGNGQELLAELLSGLAPAQRGSVRLDGAPLASTAPIAFIPEQPLLNGCAPSLSVLLNLAALSLRSFPFFHELGREESESLALLDRFDVRPRELERPVGTLSGGNAQKLVAARELSRDVALVVACFPTMGLDVAAAGMIMAELASAAARGAAVVWISEDLDVLLEQADRIAVLYRGGLRGPVPVDAVTRDALGAWMTGEAA